MLICENFLLVFLQKWEHRGYAALDRYCLLGAGILDLYFRGKIMLEGKKLILIDPNPTGIDFLDEILNVIKESKKTRKVFRWLLILSGRNITEREDLILKNLENQGILQYERRVHAKIFENYRYKFFKPEVVQSLMKQIENAFIDNPDPDIECFCLIYLIKMARVYNNCISKENRSRIYQRMQLLLRHGNYDPNHLEMFKRIKKDIGNALSG
jgi:hypothetical protein